MKRLALAVAIAAVLIQAGPTHAATFGEPVDITQAVSQLAGRHITVVVDDYDPGSWGGGAWPGLPYIYIGADAFNDARVGGGHGLLVLLHELGHTTGIDVEAQANCFALQHLIPFLQANWQMPDVWMHVEAKAYATAVGFMRAQSAEYQCNT